MTVLVTAASKYGATAEIADAIGRVLAEEGVDADVVPVEQVNDVGEYDALVLGSGVYMGRWLEKARQLVERDEEAIRARPTWLFSSGPVGDPPHPDAEDAVDATHLLEHTSAVDHRLFPGKIDHQRLGLGERLMLRAVGAADGDYRDWAAIEAWAREIAAGLRDRGVA